MTRYFCDVCGREIKGKDSQRVRRKKKNVQIEVMIAVDGSWGGGCVCVSCLSDVLLNGKSVVCPPGGSKDLPYPRPPEKE